MKKISLFLTVCILVSCLCGCGGKAGSQAETIPLPEVPQPEGETLAVGTGEWKEYELACGLTFFGPRDLEETEVDGMAAYLRNTYFLVMVIEEPRAGTVLENATREEYAQMLASANALEPFVMDRYGNLATTNTALGYEEDYTFFYYVTVMETEDSFWLVQIACPEELAASNVDDMAQWSATFARTTEN